MNPLQTIGILPNYQLLLLPAVGWSYIGPLPHECTDSTPYQETPGSKADVIFRGKALETHGIDTFMEVISVEKGDVPAGKDHFQACDRSLKELHFISNDYYVLKKGQAYLIYANKTITKTSSTQLYIPYDLYA